jgi:hypothetical protein
VLVAASYAAAHLLHWLTLCVTDLQHADCVVDHATNTIHVRPGLALNEVTALVTAGVRALCHDSAVVIDDDGATWLQYAAVTASGEQCPAASTSNRPQLRLVPPM